MQAKRFVRSSEPKDGARLDEAQIKGMTGGEEIKVRHLRKDFFNFKPKFKLIISGNHKPSIRGNDEAIWSRLLLVPWLVRIPKEERDKMLTRKLWEERAGILNWILDGLAGWLEDGLKVPDEIRTATDLYRAEQDPLGRFIVDCVREDFGCELSASEFYRSYEIWAKAELERVWSKQAVGKSMRERGYDKRKSHGDIVYLGIRLENVPSDGPPPPDSDGFGGVR